MRLRRPEARPDRAVAGTNDATEHAVVKALFRAIAWIHGLTAGLFAVSALVLIAVAVRTAWVALADGVEAATGQVVIEAVGYLAAAVVALQIAQTVAEEEIVRDAHISAPTRVRRFLSRFLVVIVVALSIESLVATFKALHEDASQLPMAASLVAAVGVLLAGWGVFLKLNTAAEALEPEAMEEAKQEDRKLA